MPNPVIEKAQERASEEMTGMSFLDHLEELRRRIIYSFLYAVAGFCVCWWYHEQIFGLMQKPIVQALANHGLDQKLVYLNPTDAFNMYLKVAFLAGIFVASPFILYQVWAFISPGLYRHERRYVLPFMFSTVGLFLAGGFFGYKMVFPAALDFLIGWSSQFKPMVTISEYTDLFITIIAGLGHRLRDADPRLLPLADGHPHRGLDVAQPALLHSGDLHHRRGHHPDHRHHEHVHLRRAHDPALPGEHRHRLVRASRAEKEEGGEGWGVGRNLFSLR